MNWYTQVLFKYAEFNGRARRSEYWYFVLDNISFTLPIYFVDASIGAFGVLGYSINNILILIFFNTNIFKSYEN